MATCAWLAQCGRCEVKAPDRPVIIWPNADVRRRSEIATTLPTGVPSGRRIGCSLIKKQSLQIRALRSSLERVFRAEVTGRKPVAADLAAVSREASAAASAAMLQHRQGRLVRRIDPAQEGAATLRWRLADAAVELLTSAHMARVKACPRCGWLFRDESKNGSRRWCNMATCGSIEKSRAYYARTRRKVR